MPRRTVVGSRSITPLLLNLGTQLKLVDSFIPWLLQLQEKTTLLHTELEAWCGTQLVCSSFGEENCKGVPVHNMRAYGVRTGMPPCILILSSR